MTKRKITKFICSNCFKWVRGCRCPTCKQGIQAGDSCCQDKAQSCLYGVYRPPRPATMSPVKYHRKYKCVDHRFWYQTNNRYYCNPAHCSKSWKNKETRDKHLAAAYRMLS